MQSLSKNQILASSSGWVATVLNFFPGLGAGYLYQRRWIPYFGTAAIAGTWFIAGVLLNNRETEISEIEQLIGLGGLLFISITTMLEANLAYRKSIKEVEKEIKFNESVKGKKIGIFGL